MKYPVILATLIGAAALSVFPAMPRASAQETLKIWCYQPGTGGTRLPRTGTGPHYVLFSQTPNLGPQPSPGSSFNAPTIMPPPPACLPSNLTYVLAYITIAGGAYGDITVVPDANGKPSSVPITMPNTPNPQYSVNGYYLPEGGVPCPPGAVCGTAHIDEWGETQGALLSDTFVTVSIPPSTAVNAGLTQSGNVMGTVSTGTQEVQINALNPPLDGSTPTTSNFDMWVSEAGGTVNGNALTVAKGTTIYALALYHSPCPDGTYWNPTATVNQCSPPPTCPIAGEVWNPITKKCVMPHVPPIHCPTCPKDQHCVGPIDFECDCTACSGGATPTPGGKPM